MTSSDHCISVSSCERQFLWMTMSSRRHRLWLRLQAKNSARCSRNWRAAVCGVKGKRPAGVACRFSRCQPMLRLSRAIAPGGCSLTTRRETRPTRYKCPVGTRLAKSSAPRRGPSLVSRQIKKRMGDLRADATRIRPSFLQPRLHFSGRASAAGCRAAERTVSPQTASILAFAGREKPRDLPPGSRSSAGERRLSRRLGPKTAGPSRHPRFQAPGSCRRRRSGVGHYALIIVEEGR